MRVKICGITNIEDAMAAVEAGADLIGFVFAESPRKVDPETARRIRGEIPSRIITVGVFADHSEEEVVRVMSSAGLAIVQAHGNMTISDSRFPWEVTRSLRVKSAEDIQQATHDPLFDICWAILLDTHVEGKMGGTGTTFDWDLAVQAHSLGKPIILAGGLTPDNVEEAACKVRPYAVDVCTGVEASPGKKNHDKIKEFIQNAKRST